MHARGCGVRRLQVVLRSATICLALGCSSSPDPMPGTTASPAATMAGASAGTQASSAPTAASDAGMPGQSNPNVVTYTEVFKQVIEGCGASFCHGGNVGMFFVGNQAETYRQLVSVPAMDNNAGVGGKASCASLGLTRVVPGDPAASLLYLKLTGTQPCGEAMPPASVGPLLAADKLDLVKRWIEGGALPGIATDDGPVAEPLDASVTFDAGAVMGPAEGASNWTFFGFDGDNSFYNRSERKLSKANVPMLAPLWMLNTGTGMYATPAVVDGVVYYPERDRVLVAVNASDGMMRWRSPIGGAVTYGEVNSSPLVTADRVYIAGMGTAFAFDRENGTRVWATTLGTHPDQHIYSSPVPAGDLIVIGVAAHELVSAKADYTAVGSVAAMDKTSGEIRWQIPTGGRQVMSKEGMPSGDGVSVWSTAAVDPMRKLVFIGSGQSYEAPASALSDSLLAIDYEKGTLAWHYQFTENDAYVVSASCERGCQNDLDVGAAPNLFKVGERDAVGVGSKAGIYKAFDRETGEELWSAPLTDASPAGGQISSAAVGDGAIYVLSNQWNVYRFPTSRGGHDPMDVGMVYKLDAATGTPIWPAPVMVRAPAVGHITLANGVIYFGLVDGWAYALDADTGAELWKFDLGHDLACGFSIVDGVIYGGSGGLWMSSNSRPGGNIFAFTAP
jgi:polyvinyl alcohol dehydrogenase (cytochrome)